jgi:hypothetical protein
MVVMSRTLSAFLDNTIGALRQRAIGDCIERVTAVEKVCQAVDYVVAWGLEHRELGAIAAIGVDEIQYAKCHKYFNLVSTVSSG